MIDLEREGDVFVVRFDAPDNRFRPNGLTASNDALDEVAAALAGKADPAMRAQKTGLDTRVAEAVTNG